MFACPLGNCSKKTKIKNKPSVSNILNNDSIDLIKVDAFLSKIINLKHENDIVKENVYDDLELFKGIDKAENSILNSIDRTKTISGKILIKNLLQNPTTNSNNLLQIPISGFVSSQSFHCRAPSPSLSNTDENSLHSHPLVPLIAICPTEQLRSSSESLSSPSSNPNGLLVKLFQSNEEFSVSIVSPSSVEEDDRARVKDVDA